MAKPTNPPPAPKAPGVSKEPAPQSPDDNVRVYNKSRKPYTHEVYGGDAAGRAPAKYISAPASFATVPRWLAEKWLGMFPHDMVAGDEALRAIDPGQAEVLALREKSAQLEADKTQLDLEVAELKKQLAEARGEK